MSMRDASNERIVRIACRAMAVSIALLAAIDPGITSTRNARPLVSVVAAEPARDAALVARVTQALRRDARVISAPLEIADATVLVGDALPSSSESVGSPSFVVRSTESASAVSIVSVQAPISSSVHAPARIGVTLRVPARLRGEGTPGAPAAAARAAALELSLASNGVLIDRKTIALSERAATRDTVIEARLAFVPSTVGATRLRVEARVAGIPVGMPADSAAVASTEVVIDVHDRPLAVLVYDLRPSWMSTFVRRTLERDARFTVTSRIVTSRDISSATGSAPERLDAVASTERFDAIVIGAPDALSARDVAGVERYLRERGGAVILLMDSRATGAVDRLTGVRAWSYRNDPTASSATLVDGDTNTLRTSQQLWPSALPLGATVVAQSQRTAPADRPLIWSRFVGGGQLVVSGALDAWRYRDRAVSGFDRIWPSIVAAAAGASLPPLSVQLANHVLAPGDDAAFTMFVREPALTPMTRAAPSSATDARPARTRATAMLEPDSDSLPRTAIRLWSDGAIGVLRGTLRAPHFTGGARLVVTADGHRASVPLLIDSTRQRLSVSEPSILDAWAAARGGRVVGTGELATLAREIGSRIESAPRREPWHPMRSGWWLLPFVVSLSAEWWLRRRRALA